MLSTELQKNPFTVFRLNGLWLTDSNYSNSESKIINFRDGKVFKTADNDKQRVPVYP